MEARLERPGTKKAWVNPTRKMTMEELWAQFEYDPEYEEEVLSYDGAIYDRYGNPTYGTLCAMYEEEHDIGETMTLDELFAEWKQLYEETEP